MTEQTIEQQPFSMNIKNVGWLIGATGIIVSTILGSYYGITAKIDSIVADNHYQNALMARDIVELTKRVEKLENQKHHDGQ